MVIQRDSSKRYSLRQPCRNCPFRADITPFLRPERAREIADALRAGGEFPCHKTTVPDDEGQLWDDPYSSKVCAGALATMEREGVADQMMRISERLGLYEAERLSSDAPVYGSLTEWVRAHQDILTVVLEDGTELEHEHCGVVGPDCEDPAGYGGFGMAYANDAEPTCHPVDDTCWACGHSACAACRSDEWGPDGQYCAGCTEAGDPPW